MISKSFKVYMMHGKKIIICLAFVLLAGSVQGQNFKEWFQQKKTQKRYLVEQIVALQVYLEVARKGYKIVQAGWKTVELIRDGDLSQHRDYFGSLETVSPAVSGYHRVAAAIEMQDNIHSIVAKGRDRIDQNAVLAGMEKKSVLAFYTKILDESLSELKYLERIVRNHDLEMTDAERLEHINSGFAAMLRLYQTLWVYDSRISVWTAQRQREFTFNQNLQKFYEYEN